jgi:hypothetical protein
LGFPGASTPFGHFRSVGVTKFVESENFRVWETAGSFSSQCPRVPLHATEAAQSPKKGNFLRASIALNSLKFHGAEDVPQ